MTTTSNLGFIHFHQIWTFCSVLLPYIYSCWTEIQYFWVNFCDQWKACRPPCFLLTNLLRRKRRADVQTLLTSYLEKPRPPLYPRCLTSRKINQHTPRQNDWEVKYGLCAWESEDQEMEKLSRSHWNRKMFNIVNTQILQGGHNHAQDINAQGLEKINPWKVLNCEIGVTSHSPFSWHGIMLWCH